MGNGVCGEEQSYRKVRADLGISCLSFVGERALKRIPLSRDSSSYGIKRE